MLIINLEVKTKNIMATHNIFDILSAVRKKRHNLVTHMLIPKCPSRDMYVSDEETY